MKFQSPSVWILVLSSMAMGLSLTPTALARKTQEKEELPKIIRKSGGVLQGSANRRVEPAYPPLAKAARVSGAVVVEVTLDEKGNVISARAISGHPLLKDAAVDAAKGWRFSPTLLAGVPVKVIGTLTFNFHLGDSSDAEIGIKELEKQVTASPDSSELIYRLGVAYLNSSEEEKAMDAFKRAIDLKPDFAEAYYELAYACHRLNRDDEAVEFANVAVKIDPKSRSAASANLLMGTILLVGDRIPEAISHFKEVLAIRADSADSESDAAHIGLGYAYVKTGDKESARREYEIVRTRGSMGPYAIKHLKELIDAIP